MALIFTTLGDIDEALLEKREGIVDNDHECTRWVEYRLIGEEDIIHRSVHVTLKEWPPGLGAILGQFN